MSAVVLDTDVWSFLFKGDSRAEHYRRYLEDNVLCISFQTVAELYQWMETAGWGERRRERLYQWLRRFQVLVYDDATSLIWARIRSSREKQGRPVSAQDAWVAACALRHGSTLLTHNAGDYEGIQNLDMVSAKS
ncbi:MAG: type II toxin-antitoxin system VapC family toxin [Anaerolineae bacterium]|nr:type II toxin-antitoxin system VapC family toxin [Anaerolineae bacterium]